MTKDERWRLFMSEVSIVRYCEMQGVPYKGYERCYKRERHAAVYSVEVVGSRKHMRKYGLDPKTKNHCQKWNERNSHDKRPEGDDRVPEDLNGGNEGILFRQYRDAQADHQGPPRLAGCDPKERDDLRAMLSRSN